MKRDDFSNNFFRFSIQAHSRTYVQMTLTENVLIEAVNFRSRRTRLSLLTIFLKAGLLALV